MLIDTRPNEDFYVMNGNRALIKRESLNGIWIRLLLYKNSLADLPISYDRAIWRLDL
jgi:hypothetical protein